MIRRKIRARIKELEKLGEAAVNSEEDKVGRAKDIIEITIRIQECKHLLNIL